MPPTEDEFIRAADALLERLERDADINEREAEAIRRDLVGDIRDIGETGTETLQTFRVGGARVLVPNSENLRKINLTTQRTRRRFTEFRLQWLDKSDIAELTEGPLSEVPTGKFIRQSKRLARGARIFLREIEEFEPTLAEEIQATLRQIDDAENDLMKLEVRSWTRVDENLRRLAYGGGRKTTARKQIRSFDVNRNIWNLSLVEHPKAVTRDLLARAAEKMARRVTKTASEIPKNAFLFVGAGPNAVARMTPGSRAGSMVWRVFSASDLDAFYSARAGRRLSYSSWRSLGLSYNTPEWYIPIPPGLVLGVREIMRGRRSDFLSDLEDLQESLPPEKV